MLLAVFAITWGSAAMGAAIMSMDRDDSPSGGLPAAAHLVLAPLRRTRARSRP
jgi:hypothetical protein